jgi:hypothetical protein
MMHPGKAERRHLIHGFVGRPALVGHAVRCDCHARAIVA